MLRWLLLPLFLLSISSALAQENDGRLYNPPGLEMRGWLDRNLRTRRQRVDDTGGVTDMVPPGASSTVVVERRATEVVQTLLPIIFFDVGEARFAARYRLIGSPAISGGYADTTPVNVKMSEASFGEDPSIQQRTAKYYELVDIVGCRLRRYPDARLRLEGGYSGESGESAELATRRAETVRDHLVTMWGIAPERITLLAPRRVCTAEASLLRQEEGRRVVFLCDDPRVLQPVRFDMLMANEMMLNLQFTVMPRFEAQDIRDMELSVGIGDALVYRGSLPVSRDSSVYHYHGITPIMWAVDNPSTLNEQIVAQVVVTLNDGRRFLSNQSKLAFAEQRKPSTERSVSSRRLVFELPYFDWRDTTITAIQSPMLALMVHSIDSALAAPRSAEDLMEDLYPEDADAMMAEAVATAKPVEPPVVEADTAVAVDTVAVESAEMDPEESNEVVTDTSVAPIEPYEEFESDYRYVPPHRTVISTKPRLVIAAGADPTEGFDTDITPYLSMNSFEPWRAMSNVVMQPLLDRANPPRMLMVAGEEIDDKEAQMAWLGFDVEQQMESMMAEQRARIEKIEADTAFFSSENPVNQLREQRMTDLARGRRVAMQSLFLRSGFADTARVAIRLDDDGRDYNGGMNRYVLSALGASGLTLPERRYAARRVTVTLRFDPEYRYTSDSDGSEPDKALPAPDSAGGESDHTSPR